MILGRLCQIILKWDKEINGYGQLGQHKETKSTKQLPYVAI